MTQIFGMRNPYLESFLSRLEARFAEDRQSMSYSAWICANTRLRKKPFSFEGYWFQKQIADDMHPDLSVIKLSQVGMTEIQLRKFFAFLVRNTGVSGIFTLPNDEMFKRVSRTRARPLVESEKVFNLETPTGEKPVRSMELYQIGTSFGYFTGNKESDATSIPADLLFHDELDLSDMQMIALFQSRLQNSNFKITHKFSTPTFVGYGIDAAFNSSDQHEYLCRCESCGHWNLPDFFPQFLHLPGLPDLDRLDQIDQDIASRLDFRECYVKCERCGSSLDLDNPELREWVPRFPGRLGRGYRIRCFSSGRITIPYIVRQLLKMKEMDNLRGWYNTVLGQAYNDSNARLDETQIRACMHSANHVEVSALDPVVIGIDVGQTCHLVLGKMDDDGSPLIFDWRQVDADVLPDEIDQLLKSYNIIGGCMDRHPYTPLANEIRDLSEGRIVPVEYRGTSRITVVNDELGEFSHLQANRTMMLDSVASAIRKRKLKMVGYGMYETQIIEHLRDMVRVENPDTPAVWNKLTGNDHFFHALAFLFLSIRYVDLVSHMRGAENRVSATILGVMEHHPASHLGSATRRRLPISIGLYELGR